MTELSPDDAELLRLWAWEQLTPGEIATVLDITSNAASIRLHRAKEKLRAALRKVEADAGHEGTTEGGDRDRPRTGLELQTRLRAADPASSLPPADPDRLAQLLEAAMSDTTTRAPSPARRAPAAAARSPGWCAAAAVVLIAAAGIFGMAQRDHGSSPAAQESVTQLGFSTARRPLPGAERRRPEGSRRSRSAGPWSRWSTGRHVRRDPLVPRRPHRHRRDHRHPVDSRPTLVQAADLTGRAATISCTASGGTVARVRLHRSRTAGTCRRSTTGPSR